MNRYRPPAVNMKPLHTNSLLIGCPPRLRGAPLAAVLCGLALIAEAALAAEPSVDVRPAVITLSNGDHAAGQLIESVGGEALVWKADGFADDLQFPLDLVQGIRFRDRENLPPPAGDYCFELAGRDLLYGSLVSLDAQTAVIEVGGLGRLHVARSVLRRISRRDGSELVYSGFAGLEGWEIAGKADSWREDAGHLVTDVSQAAIFQDLKIPTQARIEIELAWKKRPQFQLQLATTLNRKKDAHSFALDVWDDTLVAVCEASGDADVAEVEELKAGEGRIALQVFLDQQAGSMLITSSDGEPLAELSIEVPKPEILDGLRITKTFGGLRLTNTKGDLRLENLRVYRWDARRPIAAAADSTTILHSDGSTTSGQLVSYDHQQNQFVVQSGVGETRLDRDRVQSLSFPAAGDNRPCVLRAVLLSGMRASGNLERADRDRLVLKCPGIAEPLAIPTADLLALTGLQRSTRKIELPGRTGRLEMHEVDLHGCLVDGSEGATSCLVWQTLGSDAVSRLSRDASARVIYRDANAQSKKPVNSKNPNEPVVRRFAIGQAVLRQLRRPAAPDRPVEVAAPDRPVEVAATTAECVLHLRSGDTIPCRVTAVDEQGITFTTSLSDATYTPHERVKVLELLPNAAPVQIISSKKQRLLTLPRMQRDSPPTQLIRAVNGDYLRGRLVAMDDKELQVELRLEIRTIPRATVARIIWLHADEFGPDAKTSTADSQEEKPAEEPPQRITGTRVQAIPRDGNRLTFFAEQMAGSVLIGQSDLLGTCRVDVNEIDELLIGKAIDQAAAALAFHRWKLTPAIDPLEFQDNGTPDGNTEGMESVLVGKPAPQFELRLLDGKQFRLSDQRDKILVLDFWASWCGPCLQAMPQVHQVVGEFADQHVELVAINLQEAPEQIKAALQRLQLDMTVALDSDGRVAEKYGATAIPQTVIIGRDGKVARLFVGGGARFDEQLREALTSVLSPGAKQPDPQP
jgi:peroxiredoxin